MYTIICCLIFPEEGQDFKTMEFPRGFHPSYLGEDFFRLILNKINPDARLIGFHQVQLDSSHGTRTTLEKAPSEEKKIENYTGFCCFHLDYEAQTKQFKKSVPKN